jgi:ribosomal protein L37AE/L43A
LLNDYSNIKIREQIENEILKDYMIYSQKLAKITKLLRDLAKNKIQFIGDDNYYKLIDEFTTCIVKNKDACIKSPNLCMFTDTNTCNLILPTKNLITGKLNEENYFGKMSDELIRYSRIKSFILQPQSFLLFGNIGYNLREDEIIMLQSLLTQEYFETLEPAIINKYVKFNSYDETEPIITQTYENKVKDYRFEATKNNVLELCHKKINDRISSGIWKKCFPEKFKEIEYSKNVICTFEIIIDIIEKKTGEKIHVHELKNILYEEYTSYIKNYPQQIIDILITEGKKNLGDQVNSNMLSFSNFIYSDNYFLTVFDYWLLVNKYKIPTCFISTKKLLQTSYENNIFLGYSYDIDNIVDNGNERFCFIIVPALLPESVPIYKLVTNDKNDIFISIKELKDNCKDDVTLAFDNKITIETYLKNFVKIDKPKKNRIPLSIKLSIEEDVSD